MLKAFSRLTRSIGLVVKMQLSGRSERKTLGLRQPNTPEFVLISNSFCGTGAWNISENTPSTPIYGQILPCICCSGGESRFPVKTNILNVFLPNSRRVLGTHSSLTNFFKNCFFEISQKLLEVSKEIYRIKFVVLYLLHRRGLLYFSIFLMVFEI